MKERIIGNITEFYESEIKDWKKLRVHLWTLLRGAGRLYIAMIEGALIGTWRAVIWWGKLYLRLSVGACGAFFGLYMLGSSHAGHALQGEEAGQFFITALRWIVAGWWKRG